MKTYNRLISLHQKGDLKNALKLAELLIEKNPEIAKIHNFLGLINSSLYKNEESLKNFSKATEIKKNYAEAHNNKGVLLNQMGRFKEASEEFNKAITIRPYYAAAYKGQGDNLIDLGKYEEGIQNYSKALDLKPDFTDAKIKLIESLTFFNSKKQKSNSFVSTNNLLQNLKLDYDLNKKIRDEEVIDFFQKSNEILFKNIKNHEEIEFDNRQLFRRGNLDLNCERHKTIFENFNTIAKYCFGCFKVQIDPKNIIDLIKLFLVFDRLKLPNSKNIKKCLIEMRPDISGSYKGLVYCFSLKEAEEVKIILTEILTKVISKTIKIKIRRGCTEFGEAYPKYEEVDKKEEDLMKYNEKWLVNEKLMDERLPKRKTSKERVILGTNSGISLNDILVIHNWLIYAKKIGDLSYKKIVKNDQEILSSPNMDMDMSLQLSERVSYFSSN